MQPSATIQRVPPPDRVLRHLGKFLKVEARMPKLLYPYTKINLAFILRKCFEEEGYAALVFPSILYMTHRIMVDDTFDFITMKHFVRAATPDLLVSCGLFFNIAASPREVNRELAEIARSKWLLSRLGFDPVLACFAHEEERRVEDLYTLYVRGLGGGYYGRLWREEEKAVNAVAVRHNWRREICYALWNELCEENLVVSAGIPLSRDGFNIPDEVRLTKEEKLKKAVYLEASNWEIEIACCNTEGELQAYFTCTSLGDLERALEAARIAKELEVAHYIWIVASEELEGNIGYIERRARVAGLALYRAQGFPPAVEFRVVKPPEKLPVEQIPQFSVESEN